WSPASASTSARPPRPRPRSAAADGGYVRSAAFGASQELQIIAVELVGTLVHGVVAAAVVDPKLRVGDALRRPVGMAEGQRPILPAPDDEHRHAQPRQA